MLRPLPVAVSSDGVVRLVLTDANGDNPRPDPVRAAPAPRA
jgi:hypothetical protein